MDAILYLKEEHKTIRKYLKEVADTADITKKKKKFDKLCDFLLAHEKMEESVLYPVIRKNAELKDIVKHLVSEEKSAEQAMKKFHQTSFDFMWKLRFLKFKHDVEHHAKEEEKELFPKVRKILNKTELNSLGIEMRKFKKTLPKKYNN